MKKKVFKTMVKKKIWKAAFEHLQNIQTTQSKINNIKGSCQKLQRGVCGSHIVPSDNAPPPPQKNKIQIC